MHIPALAFIVHENVILSLFKAQILYVQVVSYSCCAYKCAQWFNGAVFSGGSFILT